ncbi:hypothetical protein OBBRIDRAFT_797316 [Obba rivulosa]|uniref:Uncharacterized protein n=1 Tax=Obba rivulosa TaxID=1052685 RepID=A0A8E2DHY3_9APHY|nr:hypothetical protein OBBRIDRAFT_797316 [Obba rivulosa]
MQYMTLHMASSSAMPVVHAGTSSVAAQTSSHGSGCSLSSPSCDVFDLLLIGTTAASTSSGTCHSAVDIQLWAWNGNTRPVQSWWNLRDQ